MGETGMEYDKKGFCKKCGRCCCLSYWLLGDGVVANPDVTFNPDDGWCYHISYQTKGCTIYPERPEICKEWPRSPDDMKGFIYALDCGYYFVARKS